MALSSRIQTISIREDEAGDNWGGSGSAAWEYDLTTQNFTLDHQDVYWNDTDADEALDGSLRQNFRGYRLIVTIDWEKITNHTFTDQVGTDNRLRFLLNDIVTSLNTNGDDGVQISFDGGSNWDLFVPSNLSKITRFQNQVASASSRLEFRAQQLTTTIPERFEAPSV